MSFLEMSSKFEILCAEVKNKREEWFQAQESFNEEKERVLKFTTEHLSQVLGEFNGKSPYEVRYNEKRNRAYMILKGKWNEVELIFEDDDKTVYIGLENTNATLAVNTKTGKAYREPDREIFVEMLPIVSWLVSQKNLTQSMINEAFCKFKNQ